MYLQVNFSEHSKRQLKRRNITQKVVLETISFPESITNSFRERELRQKRFGSKLLEVVTRTEDSKIVVITAYYLKDKS